MGSTWSLRLVLHRLRSRPWLLVGGAASALATMVALGAAIASLFVMEERDVGIWLAFCTSLVVYDVALLVTKPAVLPGLYALVRRDVETSIEASIGILGAEARAHYGSLLRASSRARLAGVGYSLLLAPVVVALVLTVATALSIALYGVGVLETPDPEPFVIGAILTGLAVWTIGKWPVAFSETLTIEGEPPSTAWLASARLVRRRPGAAGGVAALRIALGSLPAVVLLVALFTVFEDQPGTVVGPLATFAVPLLLVKPLEGAVVAMGYDGLDVSPPVVQTDRLWTALEPDRLRPSGRTVLAVLLVVGLLLSIGALRVTDARPSAEPESPAMLDAEDPDAYYAVARERTTTSSRSVTLESYGGNWSESELSPEFRSHVAVDYTRRAGAFEVWFGDDGSWEPAGRGYFTDGLDASTSIRHGPSMALDTRRTGSWSVSAAPSFPDQIGGLPSRDLPGDGDAWTTVSRDDGRRVLAIDDPEAVARQTGITGEDVEFRDGSRIRVQIDESTQRVSSVTIRQRYVVYEQPERETVRDRRLVRRTLEYEYDDGPIERPDEIGRYPWGYLWDAVYY